MTEFLCPCCLVDWHGWSSVSEIFFTFHPG